MTISNSVIRAKLKSSYLYKFNIVLIIICLIISFPLSDEPSLLLFTPIIFPGLLISIYFIRFRLDYKNCSVIQAKGIVGYHYGRHLAAIGAQRLIILLVDEDKPIEFYINKDDIGFKEEQRVLITYTKLSRTLVEIKPY